MLLADALRNRAIRWRGISKKLGIPLAWKLWANRVGRQAGPTTESSGLAGVFYLLRPPKLAVYCLRGHAFRVMIEVYRDIDSAKVGLIDGILQESGIATLLKNFAGGSNITEVPIPALYPTIYVLDRGQVGEALEIIESFFAAKPEGAPDWTCAHCGAEVDGFLGECWSCQHPKE